MKDQQKIIQLAIDGNGPELLREYQRQMCHSPQFMALSEDMAKNLMENTFSEHRGIEKKTDNELSNVIWLRTGNFNVYIKIAKSLPEPLIIKDSAEFIDYCLKN